MENQNIILKEKLLKKKRKDGWEQQLITMNWIQFKNLSENTVHELLSLYMLPVINLLLFSFKSALLLSAL